MARGEKQHRQPPEQEAMCNSILPRSRCSGPSRTLQPPPPAPRATSHLQGHVAQSITARDEAPFADDGDMQDHPCGVPRPRLFAEESEPWEEEEEEGSRPPNTGAGDADSPWLTVNAPTDN